MNEPIHEKVSVLSSYDQSTGAVIPHKIRWRGRLYTTDTVGLHYTTHAGKKLLHYFSLSTDTGISLKLCLDTDTLSWILEEIIDASVN